MRSEERRLTRLRELIGKLERLPASDQRERALSEVRARIVDVETGEVPRVMRPNEEAAQRPQDASPRPPAAERVPKPKPKRAPATVRREHVPVLPRQPAEPVSPAPPAAPAAADDVTLGGDDLLWLEDQAADDPGADGDHAGAPWKRGLRG